jgi:hypothetical protein
MMFGKAVVRDMIDRSAESPTDRRLFMKAAGVAGLGTLGAGALTSLGVSPASAAPSDGSVLNFALNLEYLEAEFYSHAVFGHSLGPGIIRGKGKLGGVTGGHKVPFKSKKVRQIASEIAHDEIHHVEFLRTALGAARVARPAIDLKHSFTAAARAAGLIGPHAQFDPFANENNFLLAAFIFEDVGVTAYKGAAPLINNKTYLEAAAGILAVEAYHAGIVRSALFDRGLGGKANKISDARDSLDGSTQDDQHVTLHGRRNLVPANRDAIAYSRSADRVLNVVYLNPNRVGKGGFYPAGVNGDIHISAQTK